MNMKPLGFAGGRAKAGTTALRLPINAGGADESRFS